MKVLCFLDKDFQTSVSIDLQDKLSKILKKKGYSLELVELGKNDLVPCLGCISCFSKHPGFCVSKDRLIEINKIFLLDKYIIIHPLPSRNIQQRNFNKF